MSEITEIKFCPKCGKDVDSTWVKCPYCANLMRCLKCHTEIQSNWVTCPTCGTNIKQMIPKAAATQPTVAPQKPPKKGYPILMGIIALVLALFSASFWGSGPIVYGALVMVILSVLILPYFSRSILTGFLIGSLWPLVFIFSVHYILTLFATPAGLPSLLDYEYWISVGIGAVIGTGMGALGRYTGKGKGKGGKGISLGDLKGGLDVAKKGLDVAGAGLDVASSAQDFAEKAKSGEALEAVKSGVELASTAEFTEELGVEGEAFDKIKAGVEVAASGVDFAENLGADGDAFEKLQSGVELAEKTVDLADALGKDEEEEEEEE